VEEKVFEEAFGDNSIFEEKRKEWDDYFRKDLPEQVKELRTTMEVVNQE